MANVRGSGVKNRRKKKTDEPPKYLSTGRGRRVLNPKWTAWNKSKKDASDLKVRKEEDKKEKDEYVPAKVDAFGQVTPARKRTGSDRVSASLAEISKYTTKKETKKDPYTGKSEVTSESAADKAAKTPLKIGSSKKEGNKVENSKTNDTGGTSDSDKKAWIKKTRNSPAAKSGAFKPEERWKIQKALREKKKAKLSIKNGKK